jgi:2',3'-cyclic-nucleotide 2'-phosphodiesterase/3'-nucleotidase
VAPDIPFSSFDVIEGLSYVVDPAKQPGMGRSNDLRHAGRPVQLTDQFVLATNSYRADGGGGFAMAVEAPLVLEGEVLISDILRDYIAAIGVVPPLAREPGWRFAPLPGTSVTYDAPVDARATATEIGLEEVGEISPGILRFRLRL